MNIRVLRDARAVAEAGAVLLAESARSALASRGRFTLGVSGGHTPWVMLGLLARMDLPWPRITIVQVDERVVPADSPDRNLGHLREALLTVAPLPAENVLAMPVDAGDLEKAAAVHARTLEALCGSPPVLDVIHLGLGADGHTASLVPEDPVLALSESWVGVTRPYQRHRRMTLTYPVLNSARAILFVVTGDDKREALRRLAEHDETCPAGRITNRNVVVLADRAAAALLERAAPQEDAGG